LQRCGPRGVFIGKYEKTIVQIGVDGIPGEVAATLGLFAKI
jgi:hypothetical protein